MDAKPNEIPAVRDLLKAFASLAGAVVNLITSDRDADSATLAAWVRGPLGR